MPLLFLSFSHRLGRLNLGDSKSLPTFRSLLPQRVSSSPDTQVAVFTTSALLDSHRLLRVTGWLLGHPASFLLDCGASRNFVSVKFIDRFHLRDRLVGTTRSVRGYDGTSTPSPGELLGTLRLSSTSPVGTLPDSSVVRPFLVAPLHGEDAILGIPWLREFNPVIDWNSGVISVRHFAVDHRLVTDHPPPSSRVAALVSYVHRLYAEPGTHPSRDGSLFNALSRSSVSDGPASSSATDGELSALRTAAFSEFADVFSDQLPFPPSRSVDHRIDTIPDARIPNRAGHRHSAVEDALINAQVAALVALGHVRPCQSAWAANCFLVAKKGTTDKRLVADYRWLNEITIKSSYPLPRMDELHDMLQGAKYYSKLDLRTGFYQIRIVPEHIHKTAFRTSQGLFEYCVLAMGLCNAPGTFMQLMNETFAEWLHRFVLVFLDDIIVFSRTLAEHREHVRLVLARLRERKLFAKASKCSFYQTEVEFLGHHVGVNGLRVMEDKIEAITNWPIPKRVRDVRAFLGLTGFYRRFIKDYSRLALPLTALTRTVTGAPFSWGNAQQASFDSLILASQRAPVLILPDPSLPFVLHTDASGFALGAVLQQDQGHGLQPIAFLSKKLSDAETRYPVHEQELLAIVTALATWSHYLRGAPGVRILTDHRSLTHFRTQPMLSGRQTRWVQALSQYDYTIEYIKGSANAVADALSRRSDLADSSALALDRPVSLVDPARPSSTQSSSELMSCTIFHSRSDSLIDELARLDGDQAGRRSARLAARQPLVIRRANSVSPGRDAPASLAQRGINIVHHRELQRQAARRIADRVAARRAAEEVVDPAPDRPAASTSGSRLTPTQRCTADNKKGAQCGCRTTRGQYCWHHLRALCGLRYALSAIPLAGMGVFATRDFARGAHLADYSGDRLVPVADGEGGPYCLELRRSLIVDASRMNTAPGRMFNDPRGSGLQANSNFCVHPNRQKGRLVAKRPIRAGEELTVSYGSAYWSSRGPKAELHRVASSTTLTGDPSLNDQLVAAALADPRYQHELSIDRKPGDSYSAQNGFLVREGRLCVPAGLAVRTALLSEAHDSAVGGHFGRDKTIGRLRQHFYWRGMDEQVQRYVTTCDACQRNKSSQQLPLGELMPLPVPSAAWHTVTLDLITQLPKSKRGNDAIVVFVCKLTRSVHFAACRTDVTAPQLAELFLHNVVRAHGLPVNVISDRDARFTASFWRTLWHLLGTTLRMSTAFHPQTDGQTENANKTLETVLRSTVNFKQDDWDTKLDVAELAVNSSKNATTNWSPFFLTHGFEPRLPLGSALASISAANPAAIEMHDAWRAALVECRCNIAKAQARQAKYANQHRRDAVFVVGDLVLLSTRNIALLGDAKRTRKFTSRFIGPFPITQVINKNAYKLALPLTMRNHPVFNVSWLKPYHDGTAEFPDRPASQSRPPPESLDQHGNALYEVQSILDHRTVRGRLEYLVEWRGYPVEESTWEPARFLLDTASATVDLYNAGRR